MLDKKLDETEPGGRYLGADGTWHDANGKPVPPLEYKPASEPEEAVSSEVVLTTPQTESEPEPEMKTQEKPSSKKGK